MGADVTSSSSCSNAARRKEPQQHSLGREQGERSAAARQPSPAPHKVGAQRQERCWGGLPLTHPTGEFRLCHQECIIFVYKRSQKAYLSRCPDLEACGKF